MPLIGCFKKQQSRFEELANQASKIDIAVAWAGDCHAMKVLKKCGAKQRIVVGIWGNNTNPSVLDTLQELKKAELRIAPDNDPNQKFHPKYYCFYGAKTICWVGSPNMTNGGFRRNVELICEFELDHTGDGDWFECLWNDLDEDPSALIKAYKKRYKRPKFHPYAKAPVRTSDLPLLSDIDTWKDFVEALRLYDAHCRSNRDFSVLGNTHSWLHTALVSRDVVRKKDWTQLDSRECYILRGLTTVGDFEGFWGFYGRLQGARQASYILNNTNMPKIGYCRNRIRQRIEPVLGTAISNIPHIAREAVNRIGNVHRNGIAYKVGCAAATRWLALARPDCLVAVIGPSKRILSAASGLSQNSLHTKYDELINWIHEQSWFNEFNNKQPPNSMEQDIWDCRAALVDVFTYPLFESNAMTP